MAKNVNYFHKKAPLKIFERVPNASLRLQFHPLFILGIILSLELYILAKAMFTGIKKHIEDLIKRLRYSLFSRFEEILIKLVLKLWKKQSDLLENPPTDHFEDTSAIVVIRVFMIALPFFSMGIFFHEYSQITGLQGKGEGISLTLHYHFHPLHRHFQTLVVRLLQTAHLCKQFLS